MLRTTGSSDYSGHFLKLHIGYERRSGYVAKWSESMFITDALVVEFRARSTYLALQVHGYHGLKSTK